MREKNDELVDTLVKQERICEKFKWELKKTGEALESETARVDELRKENLRLHSFIKGHVKVPTGAELDERHKTLRATLLAQMNGEEAGTNKSKTKASQSLKKSKSPMKGSVRMPNQ